MLGKSQDRRYLENTTTGLRITLTMPPRRVACSFFLQKEDRIFSISMPLVVHGCIYYTGRVKD
jgi:hypothetical protein